MDVINLDMTIGTFLARHWFGFLLGVLGYLFWKDSFSE